MAMKRLTSGNVQFQFAPGITLGTKDTEFLDPPSENNAQKLRTQLQNHNAYTSAGVRAIPARRPETKMYSRVAVHADTDDDEEDKENKSNNNPTTHNPLTAKVNTKPKPNFGTTSTTNLNNKANKPTTARSPRRSVGNPSPRRATGTSPRRTLSNAGNQRRAAQGTLNAKVTNSNVGNSNVTQRSSARAAQVNARAQGGDPYSSTIPQAGLVARLANKILQKWFNNRKEYSHVELYNLVDPPSPLFDRSPSSAQEKQESKSQQADQPIVAAPAPPPPPPPKIPPPPPPPMMKKKDVNTPSKNGIKMKQLHWSVIPSNQLKTAEFWSNISPVKFTRVNESELASLFSISPIKDMSSKPKTQPTKHVAILDVRKGNNTMIILSQFRLTPKDIREKLAAMDPDFSSDQLIALHSILTSISEQDLKLFNEVEESMADTLNTPDRFVYELLQIPLVERKVRAWLVQRQMKAHLEDLSSILSLVSSATSEVRASEKLATILKTVLALGSVLNRGTYLSNTRGFKLDTLLKLGEMKARRSRQSVGGKGFETDVANQKQNNYSLLHYLAEVISRDDPTLLSVGQDFPHVAQATGLGLDNANEILFDCKENIKKVSLLAEDLSKLNPNDPFIMVMQPFAIEAQKKIDTLFEELTSVNSLYSSLAAYYGEDPKTTSTKDFFHIISEFTKNLNQAYNDNESQKKMQLRRSASFSRSRSSSLSFSHQPSFDNLSVAE